MNRPRAPGAANEQALRIVNHLLGSTRPGRVLLVVALLASLGWFTDSLFELLADIGHWLDGDSIERWWPWHRIIGVASFSLLMLALWWRARGARKRYRPRIATDPEPTTVRGLILYLSALRPETLPGDDDIAQLADLEDYRRRFGSLPWRMPIEAIAHHRPRLERVIVISSCNRDGSRRQFATFKRLCRQLFDDGGPRIEDIAEFDSRYGPGLDFNDVEQLTAATDDAHRLLEQAGLASRDILIDVTGGKATNSIAGAAVALAEGRHIQYVACDQATGHYRVIVYDVTYDG